jgi:hypothetical protein
MQALFAPESKTPRPWACEKQGMQMRRYVSGVFAMTIFLTAATSSAAWAEAPELPAGPAKAKIQATCTTCHDTKMITKQRHDKKWWAQTLEKMEGLGAEIPAGDRDLYLKYLSTNFGAGPAGAKKKAAKN